jgi:hypothetical protein
VRDNSREIAEIDVDTGDVIYTFDNFKQFIFKIDFNGSHVCSLVGSTVVVADSTDNSGTQILYFFKINFV